MLLVELGSLFCKELLAHVGTLIKLFRSKLNINKIGFFQNFVDFIHLLSLQLINMGPQFIKKVIDRMPD